MTDLFTGAVERITRRKVVGYQSQIIVDPDHMIEMFVLGDHVDDEDGTGQAPPVA